MYCCGLANPSRGDRGSNSEYLADTINQDKIVQPNGNLIWPSSTLFASLLEILASLERSSDLSNSGEFKRQTALEIAI